MEREGLINLSVPLQVSPNNPTRISVLDIIKQFNDSVSEGYTVSKEFKDQVRPVLIRVLRKNGVGLSDTQFLVMMFGQDLIQTAFHLIDGMRQRNEVINQLKDINEAIKNGTMNFNQAPPPQQPQPQPQQSRREPEEKETKNSGFAQAEAKTAPRNSGVKPDIIINANGTRDRRRKRRENAENL